MLRLPALSALMVLSAVVQAEEIREIAPQPLAQALDSWARQTGLQVIYGTDLMRGKQSPGARAGAEPREALSQILDGSGLTVSWLNERTAAIQGKKGSAEEKPSAVVVRSDAAPVLVAQSAESAGSGETSPGAPASDSEEAADMALEEIVVTAQKRNERLQDVPLSISAVSAERLRSLEATRLTDIAATIPGMQINSQTGQPGSVNVTLRGITTADIQSTTTAITVDDVPVGSSTTYAYAALSSIDLLPYDLDHIEVLKGPQGTLYGATSLGGLVKYVTTAPDLNEFSARVGGSISNIDRAGNPATSQRAVVNIPIAPGVFALSASAGHSYQPGYIDNIAIGDDDFNHGEQDNARLTALWQAGERFTGKLTALYNSSDFNGLGSIAYDPVLGQPVYGEYQTFFDRPFRDRRDQSIFIGDLSYDFTFATLTSVTGYSDSEGIVTYDASQIPFYKANYRDNGIVVPGQFTSSTERLTQELRLAAPQSQKLRWLVGAFYNKEESRFVEHIDAIVLATGQPDPASTPFYDSDAPSEIEETALFGDLTYAISEAWDVSGGVRYSRNRQQVSSFVSGVLVGGTSQSPEFRSSDNSVTYAANTRFRLNPDAMLYARVATGFRPGGANTIVGVPPTFKPDETTSYELGLKSELLSNRALLNLAVFHIDWTDIHLTDRLPNQLPFIGNGGKATSEGVEVSAAYQLTPGVRFSTAVAYTDAVLETDAPNVGASANDPLPNTPEWSGMASLDWSHAVSEAHKLDASLAWRYVDSRISAFPDAQGGVAALGSYDAVDVTAGVSTDRWRANVFVRNLINEEALLSYSNFGGAILQPRALGISLDINF